jgi:hypothetical protein
LDGRSSAYALMFIRCDVESSEEDDTQAKLQKIALKGALEELGYPVWDILDIPIDPAWSRCTPDWYEEILHCVRAGAYDVVACVSWSEIASDQATYAALLRACIVGNVPMLDEWTLREPIALIRPPRAIKPKFMN